MGVKTIKTAQGRRYECRWTDERGKDRKKLMPRGTSMEEAQRFLRDARVRVDRIKAGLEIRERNPSRWTVKQAAEKWMKGRDERDVLSVRAHIIQTPLGAELLDKVTPAMVNAHLAELAPRPTAHVAKLAAGTLNHVRKHLVSIFKLAIERGWLQGENPASPAKRRKVTKRPLVTLTAEEAGRLVAAADPPWAGIIAAGLQGLRRGEIWGLDIGDIDLERWEIHVRRSHGATTTKSGRERVVPIHPAYRAVFAQAVNSTTTQVLFPGHDGRRRSAKSKGVREFRAALEAAKITRRVRFHDLRHTAATLMLQAGATLVHVKDVLGHSTIALTANTYAHLLTDDLRGAVERMPITIPLRAVKEGAV